MIIREFLDLTWKEIQVKINFNCVRKMFKKAIQSSIDYKREDISFNLMNTAKKYNF
jgi:hypothetical protein